MPDGTRITAEQVARIWTHFMDEPPSSAEYTVFARYLESYGNNHNLIALAIYLIHMCFRDVKSIELEILDKGPSALQQVREMIGDFNETIVLVQKINAAINVLRANYWVMKSNLEERERLDRTKWEQIYKLVVGQHHPLKLLTTLWAGMLFVNFAGLILIAYVMGLMPPLIATSTPPSEQAETSDRPMQSWQQPDRGLTPSELAAEERDGETR
jgi:hypothetical protein